MFRNLGMAKAQGILESKQILTAGAQDNADCIYVCALATTCESPVFVGDIFTGNMVGGIEMSQTKCPNSSIEQRGWTYPFSSMEGVDSLQTEVALKAVWRPQHTSMDMAVSWNILDVPNPSHPPIHALKNQPKSLSTHLFFYLLHFRRRPGKPVAKHNNSAQMKPWMSPRLSEGHRIGLAHHFQ